MKGSLTASIAVGSFVVAANLFVAIRAEDAPFAAPLMFLSGLILAADIRRFLNEERESALRFQRLVTESGGALHAADFPALHAALKRHGRDPLLEECAA